MVLAYRADLGWEAQKAQKYEDTWAQHHVALWRRIGGLCCPRSHAHRDLPGQECLETSKEKKMLAESYLGTCRGLWTSHDPQMAATAQSQPCGLLPTRVSILSPKPSAAWPATNSLGYGRHQDGLKA